MKKFLLLMLTLVAGVSAWASVTVTKTISEIVDENDYEISAGSTINTKSKAFDLDENVSVSVAVKDGATGNTGSFWGEAPNTDWRLYQNDGPSLTIAVSAGYVIESVKITYNRKNSGILNTSGCGKSIPEEDQIKSNTSYDVNDESVTYYVGNTGTATNGQAQIKAMEVVYSSNGSGSTTVTIGETGYATFYDSEHAVELPAEVEAYVFMPMYGLMPLKTVNYEITENTVPAGEPVILMAAANDYTLEYVESDLLPVNDETMYGPGTNLLQGTDVEAITTIGEYWGTMPNLDETDVYTAADCYFYGLSLNASSDPESVGFYWMEEGGAAFTNGAHKAYLCIPAEVLPFVLNNGGIDPLEARGFAFGDMNTNGISNIATESASESIYTLSGVKVNSLQKGLNIVGGKKIMVK